MAFARTGSAPMSREVPVRLGQNKEAPRKLDELCSTAAPEGRRREGSPKTWSRRMRAMLDLPARREPVYEYPGVGRVVALPAVEPVVPSGSLTY